jgi:hypothetical protein
VILSYDQKFKKLDSLFTADVVGNGTIEVVGPFEAAKKRFFKGTVIPICAGWFRKVNKDYKTLISMLAWEAAAGDNSMRISPLVNLDRKGGACQILLQQFRRTIGLQSYEGMLSTNLDVYIMYMSLWRRRLMQVPPTIAITNGTQATTDMLVGIMPIHQMDTKYTCSLRMDSSVGYFKEE